MSLTSLEILEEAIALLTLRRPEKRNALSIPMVQELLHHLEVLKKNPAIRVLILQGAGKVFCAGLDLEEMQHPDTSHTSATLIKNLLLTLYSFPCPTIASIQGGAIAGGAGLAFSCDFILSTPDAIFGFPEVRRGIIPAFVAALLKRQMPEREAKEWLLTGEVFPAKKIEEKGFLYRLVSASQLMEETLLLAKKILHGAPEAIRHTKALWEVLSPSLIEDLAIAEGYHQKGRDSKEAQEGAKAFLEKRDPYWVPKAKDSP